MRFPFSSGIYPFFLPRQGKYFKLGFLKAYDILPALTKVHFDQASLTKVLFGQASLIARVSSKEDDISEFDSSPGFQPGVFSNSAIVKIIK